MVESSALRPLTAVQLRNQESMDILQDVERTNGFVDSPMPASTFQFVSAQDLASPSRLRSPASMSNMSSPSKEVGLLEPTFNHEEHEAQQRLFESIRNYLIRAIDDTIDILNEILDYDGNIMYPSLHATEESSRLRLKRTQTQPRVEATAIGNSLGKPAFLRSQSLALESSAVADRPTDINLTSDLTDRAACTLRAEENDETYSNLDVLGFESPLNHPLFSTSLVSLNANALATLFKSRLSATTSHLKALKARVNDPTSKILVTGDLNAGKSTFINALLRRDILPVDQQPLTEVFCEVLDACQNNDTEEVHAIPAATADNRISFYDKDNPDTYQIYKLDALSNLVDDCRYSHMKIYLQPNEEDSCPQSIIHNSQVSISLIDAPGLNKDSVTSTALFARQEEIDVVVFVCSAENHFTLSGKEFLWSAGREKAFVFIVVNRFDLIGSYQFRKVRDSTAQSDRSHIPRGSPRKNPPLPESEDWCARVQNARARCRKRVLDQIKTISEGTWREAGDLVHFVDSKGMLDFELSTPQGQWQTSLSQRSLPHDSAPEESIIQEDIESFTRLEDSLRTFTLLKRAKSKLNPAKTYLLKIYRDIQIVADYNCNSLEDMLRDTNKELAEIVPKIDRAEKVRRELDLKIDATVEECAKQVAISAQTSIARCLDSTNTENDQLFSRYRWQGYLHLWQYAERVRHDISEEVKKGITSAQNYGRSKTILAIKEITEAKSVFSSSTHNTLVDTRYVDRTFNPDKMYRIGQHDQIIVDITVADLFDVKRLWEKPWAILSTFVHLLMRSRDEGKRDVGVISLTVATLGVYGSRLVSLGDFGYLTSRVFGFSRALGLTSKQWGRAATPIVSLIGLGLATSVLLDIPNAIPRNLRKKTRKRLQVPVASAEKLPGCDFLNVQVEHVIRESRKVVQIAAWDVKTGMAKAVDQIRGKKKSLGEVHQSLRHALQFFQTLNSHVKDLGMQMNNLEIGESLSKARHTSL